MLERIRNQITELRKEEERRYTYEAEFSFSKELPVQYSEWMNTIWDISNRDKIKIYLQVIAKLAVLVRNLEPKQGRIREEHDLWNEKWIIAHVRRTLISYGLYESGKS